MQCPGPSVSLEVQTQQQQLIGETDALSYSSICVICEVSSDYGGGVEPNLELRVVIVEEISLVIHYRANLYLLREG